MVYFTSGAGLWVYEAPHGEVNGPYSIDTPILGLGLSSDGKQLYVAGTAGTAQTIDVASLEKMRADP